jgi:hypothetical protein
MANYLLCHKEFKSLGMSYIELADINIDKITIQDGSKRLDRTDFLKYGCSKERQYQENVSCVKLICNISILKDDIGYYFNYIGSYISKYDKVSFNITNSHNQIFCIVYDVIGTKYYIDFFKNFEEDIQVFSFSYIVIFKYDNMEESTSLYELFIDTNDVNNSLNSNTIPFFLPHMNTTKYSEKKILIHVNKNISNFNVLITSRNNYYINNLNSNDNYYINHRKIDVDINNEYITYTLSLLYNGRKSWFIF